MTEVKSTDSAKCYGVVGRATETPRGKLWQHKVVQTLENIWAVCSCTVE